MDATIDANDEEHESVVVIDEDDVGSSGSSTFHDDDEDLRPPEIAEGVQFELVPGEADNLEDLAPPEFAIEETTKMETVDADSGGGESSSNTEADSEEEEEEEDGAVSGESQGDAREPGEEEEEVVDVLAEEGEEVGAIIGEGEEDDNNGEETVDMEEEEAGDSGEEEEEGSEGEDGEDGEEEEETEGDDDTEGEEEEEMEGSEELVGEEGDLAGEFEDELVAQAERPEQTTLEDEEQGSLSDMEIDDDDDVVSSQSAAAMRRRRSHEAEEEYHRNTELSRTLKLQLAVVRRDLEGAEKEMKRVSKKIADVENSITLLKKASASTQKNISTEAKEIAAIQKELQDVQTQIAAEKARAEAASKKRAREEEKALAEEAAKRSKRASGGDNGGLDDEGAGIKRLRDDIPIMDELELTVLVFQLVSARATMSCSLESLKEDLQTATGESLADISDRVGSKKSLEELIQGSGKLFKVSQSPDEDTMISTHPPNKSRPNSLLGQASFAVLSKADEIQSYVLAESLRVSCMTSSKPHGRLYGELTVGDLSYVIETKESSTAIEQRESSDGSLVSRFRDIQTSKTNANDLRASLALSAVEDSLHESRVTLNARLSRQKIDREADDGPLAYSPDTDAVFAKRNTVNTALGGVDTSKAFDVKEKSPLLNFRAYRLHPHYRDIHAFDPLSTRFSHRIQPQRTICRFENNGVCNDDECIHQHHRDYLPSVETLLRDLLSYGNIELKDRITDPAQAATRAENFVKHMQKVASENTGHLLLFRMKPGEKDIAAASVQHLDGEAGHSIVPATDGRYVRRLEQFRSQRKLQWTSLLPKVTVKMQIETSLDATGDVKDIKEAPRKDLRQEPTTSLPFAFLTVASERGEGWIAAALLSLLNFQAEEARAGRFKTKLLKRTVRAGGLGLNRLPFQLLKDGSLRKRAASALHILSSALESESNRSVESIWSLYSHLYIATTRYEQQQLREGSSEQPFGLREDQESVIKHSLEAVPGSISLWSFYLESGFHRSVGEYGHHFQRAVQAIFGRYKGDRGYDKTPVILRLQRELRPESQTFYTVADMVLSLFLRALGVLVKAGHSAEALNTLGIVLEYGERNAGEVASPLLGTKTQCCQHLRLIFGLRQRAILCSTYMHLLLLGKIPEVFDNGSLLWSSDILQQISLSVATQVSEAARTDSSTEMASLDPVLESMEESLDLLPEDSPDNKTEKVSIVHVRKGFEHFIYDMKTKAEAALNDSGSVGCSALVCNYIQLELCLSEYGKVESLAQKYRSLAGILPEIVTALATAKLRSTGHEEGDRVFVEAIKTETEKFQSSSLGTAQSSSLLVTLSDFSRLCQKAVSYFLGGSGRMVSEQKAKQIVNESVRILYHQLCFAVQSKENEPVMGILELDSGSQQQAVATDPSEVATNIITAWLSLVISADKEVLTRHSFVSCDVSIPQMVVFYLLFNYSAPIAAESLDDLLRHPQIHQLSVFQLQQLWLERIRLQTVIALNQLGRRTLRIQREKTYSLIARALAESSSETLLLRAIDDLVYDQHVERTEGLSNVLKLLMDTPTILQPSSSSFAMELVREFLTLFTEEDRGEGYEMLVKIPQLAVSHEVALQASDWELHHGELAKARGILLTSLPHNPAQPTLLKRLVQLDFSRVGDRHKESTRAIENALLSNPLSSPLWKLVIETEALYGNADGETAKALAEKAESCGVTLNMRIPTEGDRRQNAAKAIEKRVADLEPNGSLDLSRLTTKEIPFVSLLLAEKKDVRELRMAYNCMMVIPPAIFNMRDTLISLDLSHNALLELPSFLGHLKKLKILKLSRNNLSSKKSEDLSILPDSLEYLDLSFNLLTVIVPESFGAMSDLRHLDLRGNPLHTCPPEKQFRHSLSHMADLYLPKFLNNSKVSTAAETKTGQSTAQVRSPVGRGSPKAVSTEFPKAKGDIVEKKPVEVPLESKPAESTQSSTAGSPPPSVPVNKTDVVTADKPAEKDASCIKCGATETQVLNGMVLCANCIIKLLTGAK